MIEVIAPPVSEVTDASDPLLREHVRLLPDEDDQDLVLSAYAAAARDFAERATGRFLLTQTLRASLRYVGPRVVLPTAPVQSITALRITAADGSSFEIPPSDYRLTKARGLAEVLPALGAGWPAPGLGAEVQVDFVAGYGDTAAAVPPSILQAIRLHTAHSFRYREAADDVQLAEIPMGARDMLSSFRLIK